MLTSGGHSREPPGHPDAETTVVCSMTSWTPPRRLFSHPDVAMVARTPARTLGRFATVGAAISFREERACRPTADPPPQHSKRSSPLVVDLVRQSRFQMDDDGDLHEQILHIEAHIDELTDIIEGCRKIILISKVAIAAGGILILATIIGAVGFDPTVLIGAIAAVIGGTVVFGSNTSTLKHTMADMKAAEAHRSELISRMDLKVVGDGKFES